MDHIPQCSDGLAHPPLEVPFLANTRFTYDMDERGMIDYPKRVGVDVSLLVRDQLSDLAVARSASFLQAWLWFGIIHQSLWLVTLGDARSPWQALKLVKVISGKEYVSLKEFPDELSRLLRATAFTDRSINTWSKIRDCLCAASTFSRELVRNNSWISSDMETSDVSLILLSTDVLCQTITRTVETEISSGLVMLSPHDNQLVSLDMVNNLLVSSNWCPRDVERLPKDAIFRYHLSFYLPKTLSDEPMHPGTDGCTCKFAEAESITPKHTCRECRCQTIRINTKDLEGILSRGEIPLFRFTDEDTSGTRSLQLQGCVIQSQKPTSFVAISHVRTAELGNDISNALPSCQLSKLQILANQLQGSRDDTPIWLDTLCLPIDRQERKEALQSVWKIFKAAKFVLVLDPPLFRHTFISAQEALIRIRYSLWKRRMWTLEEGFFSRNLIFRFSTHMIPLSDLLTQFAEDQHHMAPGSRILMPCTNPLTSDQNDQLQDLLVRFGDDIRLMSREDHATGDQQYRECKRALLYRLLRLGYLMADKFRYFLEEDESAHVSNLWELLDRTYGSTGGHHSSGDNVTYPSDVRSAARRLEMMSSFPIDKWERG